MSWVIESWDALGGLAFIRRTTTSQEEEPEPEPWLLYVSAPQFVPEVVARGTALWAAHSTFQAGFFTEDGAEHEFNSLEKAVDLIRRAYLGAGGFPGPEGEDPDDEPPDGGQGGSPPEQPENPQETPWVQKINGLLELGFGEARNRLETALVQVFTSSEWEAQALIGETFFGLKQHYGMREKALATARVWLTGVWAAGESVEFDPDWLDFPVYPFFFWRTNRASLQQELLNGLFWKIPIADPKAPHQWTTLGEYLIRISRRDAQALTYWEWRPLLLAALVMAGASMPQLDAGYRRGARPLHDPTELCVRAARWLVEMLPNAQLQNNIKVTEAIESWVSKFPK